MIVARSHNTDGCGRDIQFERTIEESCSPYLLRVYVCCKRATLSKSSAYHSFVFHSHVSLSTTRNGVQAKPTHFPPFALSFPSNSQKALKVVNPSPALSSTHSAVAPTKNTYPSPTSSVFGPTLIFPFPPVQIKILGPLIGSNVAFAPALCSTVLTTLNSSMGGS
jgi:hypothetical protein